MATTDLVEGVAPGSGPPLCTDVATFPIRRESDGIGGDELREAKHRSVGRFGFSVRLTSMDTRRGRAVIFFLLARFVGFSGLVCRLRRGCVPRQSALDADDVQCSASVSLRRSTVGLRLVLLATALVRSAHGGSANQADDRHKWVHHVCETVSERPTSVYLDAMTAKATTPKTRTAAPAPPAFFFLAGGGSRSVGKSGNPSSGKPSGGS